MPKQTALDTINRLIAEENSSGLIRQRTGDAVRTIDRLIADEEERERQQEEERQRQQRNASSAGEVMDLVRSYGDYGLERRAAETPQPVREERRVGNALTPEMEARYQQANGVNRAPTAYQTYMMQVANSQPAQEETRSTDELRRDMNRQNRLARGTERMAADRGNQLTQDQSLIYNPGYTSNLRTMDQMREAQQAKADRATEIYQTMSVQRREQEEQEKYAALMSNPDFVAKSQGDPTIGNKTSATSLAPAERLYQKIFHRNDTKDANGNIKDAAGSDAARFVNDEEAAIFYYLWNTQGAKAAQSYYYGYVENRAGERRAQLAQQQAQAYGEYDPVGASIARVGYNAMSGIGLVDMALQNLTRALGITDRNKPLNYNSDAQLPGQVADALQSGASNFVEQFAADEIKRINPNVKHPENYAKVASFLYQTGMSMADSSVAIALNLMGIPEPLTLANMGAAAGTRAIREARERGATDGQALAFGFSSAIMEALFEKISLDRILEPSYATNWKQHFLNAWKQSFTEGSEEVMTTLANTAADMLIMGDKAELYAIQRQLMEQGVSEKEALAAAFKQWGTGIIGDLLGGMVSGLGMGGVKEIGAGLNNLAQGVRQDMQTARALTDYQNAQQAAPQIAPMQVPAAPVQQRQLTAREQNPLQFAMNKAQNGETVTGNDAKAILNDPQAMQTLRDAGVLAETIRPGAEGRAQIQQAVMDLAEQSRAEMPEFQQTTERTSQLPVQNQQEAAQEPTLRLRAQEEQAPRQEPLRLPKNEVAEPTRQAPLTIRGANATVEENRQEENYGQGQQTETAAAAGEDDFRARAETAAEGARRSYLDRIERSSGLGRVLQDLRNYRIVRGAESRASEVSRIRNQAKAGNQRDVSALDYGVSNGSAEQSAKELDNATASRVLGRNWDRAVAELAREGVTLKAMTGQLKKEDGSQVRAFFSGDGKTIVVQIDHPKLSWNQLLDHEDLHRRIKANKNYRKAVEDALLADKNLRAYLPEIIDRYSRAYVEHAPDLTSDDVIEELLADYRAGFDMLDPLGMNSATARAAKRAAKDIKSAEKTLRKQVDEQRPVSVDDEAKASTGKFSLNMPVEEMADLIALHNLNAEKLEKALNLGGFPMPSIAVTKTTIPHTNFGDITLVMNKDTIDPQKNRKNTVYSADAWTPTFPGVEYEADEKAASRLRSKYYELYRKYGDEATRPLYPWGNYAADELNRKGGLANVIKQAQDDTDLMKLYLMENGMDVPAAVTEESVSRLDDDTIALYDRLANAVGKDAFEELRPQNGENPIETRKRWWAAHRDAFEQEYKKYILELGFTEEEANNVLENESTASQTRKAIEIRNYLKNGPEKRTTSTNVSKTNDAIRAAVDQEKYAAWINDLFAGLEKGSGIYNGKDRYTPSGNERSFSATHYPVTLENIAKAMAAQNGGSTKNVSGFHGVKTLRAGMAKRFSSIQEMHEYEGRLKHLSEEEADSITEALADRLANVMQTIYDAKEHNKYDNSFIEMDTIGEILMEATDQKDITADSIRELFGKYRYDIDMQTAENVRELLFDVSEMPVNIFEAKPERAVRFNEVLAAVVPSGTSAELMDSLKKAGVERILEYQKGNDEDRLEKVNSIQEAKFSREIDAEYMAAAESGDMETAQRMVDEAAKKAGYALRAYHGTGSQFTVFDKSKIGSVYGADDVGFFFSSKKGVAEWAASDASSKVDNERIIDAFLKIESPLEIKTKEDPNNYYDSHQSGVLQMLYDGEHDGIIIKGSGSTTYIVFEPEQIKSADPVTYDDDGKIIPLSQRFNTKNEDIRYSLEMVDPIQPVSEKWQRGATYDEVKAAHPTLFELAADEAETRNPTQINGTVKTYRKIYDMLKQEGFDGTILDASSGLGYGTRAGRDEYGYDVDDIEPFPDKSYSPKYTDYSKLKKTYDVVISNAVLNVIPQDLRDAMVVKIGEMLNPGGRAFINVRGTDVKNAKSKVAINEDQMEYFIADSGSYQKGFRQAELVDYLKDALGDGFTVTPNSSFGGVSAVVTKNGGSASIEIDPEVAAQFSPEAIARRQSNRTKGVKGERKVSRVRSNTYEYSGLYNEVEAQMDEADEENYTYDPVSEKKSMNEALGRLKADFDGEASRLSEADRQWGGSDLDTAMGILHRYRTEGRATGDYGDFWRWSKVIQEKGTKGGQFIQAFAKYTRTGTGAAMKGAKDIHDRFKLNPAQQRQVDAAKKKLMDGIDGGMNGAAQDAMKQAKGQKEPGKKQDGKVDKKKLDAEVQRRKDAERLVREISKLFEKQQNHGEPVENWLNLTGEELARKIAGRFSEPKQRTKTTMQTILSDLVGFAEEHALPDRKKAEGTKRTAIDTITDYLNNRDAYGTAWAAAQSYLRAAYTDDQEKLDALNSFLTATIAYNAEGTDRTMLDAILQSADVLGISEKRILELTSAGATASTIDRIGDELVSQVKERMGADYDESFTQQLKDAVRRHITGIALQESAEEQRLRLGGMTTDAARQLEINLQKLLTQSRGDKNRAAQSVADYLIRELGIPSSDAAIAAERITGAFMDELANRADRKLQQMFAEKKPKTQEQRDRLLDLIRLGGLTNSNVEDAVVDALGIGGMSRERQRELVGVMAQFGETLDAMEADDLDGLKDLIRAQAAVRNTPLSRQAEKALAGETDAQYLREFALAQLDAIAGDFAEMSHGARISTFQTISHLLNMRTALRNLTSNQVFDLVDSAANNLATIPDMVIGAFTGKRTVGVNKSWLSEMKRAGAKQGAARNALEVRLDVSPDDRQKSKYGTAGRRTNSMAASNAFGRILSHLEEVMGYELNTTDEFHKGSVRGETLESLARFVERGDITQEQANAWAEEEALYRSFQDDTLVGNIMGELKTLLNVIGFGDSGKTNSRGRTIHDFGLGDLVVKYTQVPGALIHRGIEYSPLGYAKMLYDLAIAKDSLVRTQRRGEDVTNAQRKLALDIGRATTGSGLITLFAVLAKAGLLRRDDDDKDKNAKAMHAAQGLSGTQLNLTALKRWIEGGDLSLTDGDVLADIGFLEPLDSLMTIATLMANDDDLKLTDIGVKSLDGVWKAISNTSAMQTISNIISTVQYHDEENDLPLYFQIPIEIASDSISGFVPSPVRQLAQATDTTYRDQYRSKALNDQVKAKVMNSIPGLRQQLAPKITPLGEDRKYQKPLLNYLNATLNPGNINVYQGSGVVDELNRVYDETDDAKIWPERNAPYSFTANDEKYTLTPDERTQYQRTRGQTTANAMDAVMGTDWYKSMGATDQAEVLNWIGNFSNFVAKKEMLEARGQEYGSTTYNKYYEAWQSGTPIEEVVADKYGKLIKAAEETAAAETIIAGAKIPEASKEEAETMSADAKRLYAAFLQGGVSDATARNLATSMEGSEASGHEQWRMVYDAAGKEGEKAVTSVMTDDMKRNWNLAKDAGVSMDDYIKVREGFKDLNGNGNKSQDEWNATLDSFTFSTNATKDKSIKGTLWQILTGSGSTKNNPYDKEAGQKVLDAKAKGGSGSGSYAPARIPTLRIPAAPTVSKPSSGLRIRAATPAAQAPRSGLRIKAQ